MSEGKAEDAGGEYPGLFILNGSADSVNQKHNEDRVLKAVTQALGSFNLSLFFLLPFLSTHNARISALFDPAPHLLHSVTATRPLNVQRRDKYSSPSPPTHPSSPSSSHNSSSVSPSISSTSSTASLRSRTQATLRPVLPFSASETSPLVHPASTYDRLIGMRTEAIYEHVSLSEIGKIIFASGISYLANFPFFHGVFNQLLP